MIRLGTFLGFLGTVLPVLGAPVADVESLIQDLGCGSCHTGLGAKTAIASVTPDLSDAGLRYRPDYLYRYLQQPERVRDHIGPARMPDFRLSQAESLALTVFLQGEKGELSKYPDTGLDVSDAGTDSGASVEQGRVLIERHRCLDCHSLQGEGGDQAVDLARIAYRLNRRWVEAFLANPQRLRPGTPMQSSFYGPGEDGGRRERVPDPAGEIQAIAAYLYSLAETQGQRSGRQRAFRAALAEYPGSSASVGRRIFRALNCAGCHAHGTIAASRNGPDLGKQAFRVHPAWLSEFLANPIAVRPFGYPPGSGGRMPDFGLSDEEVRGIADHLMQTAGSRPTQTPGLQARRLSRFSLNKARRLMAEKLSCLGCHRLGDEGGRIGPDLSRVKQRLQPAYVYQIIRDPLAVDAHAGMPKVNLPEKTLDLVAGFLLQQEGTPSEDAIYLSLVDNPLLQPDSEGTPGSLLYGRYCAPCHGIGGDGEGFNAGYLPVMPTRFADASYLSTRPDDTLFDGVYAGGYILNRHHRMPAWGQTLSTDAIRSLVAHMRELCQCAGPSWSWHD